MKTLKAGDAYYGMFVTTGKTGAAMDATGTPVATATKNGADDVAFALTAAKIDTARYKITGTVPAGYTAADWVQVSIAATVDGISVVDVVDEFMVVANQIGNSVADATTALEAINLQYLLKTEIPNNIEDIVIRETVMAYLMVKDVGNVGNYNEAFMSLESVKDTLAAVATTDQLESAIWAQTRFRFSLPEKIESPESGTTTYTFGIDTYNTAGALADCTGTPTVTAQYSDGTSASALLGSVSNVGTGKYRFTLSVAYDMAVPLWLGFYGSATQGGDTIGMSDYTWIVDDVGYGFTETDHDNIADAKSAAEAVEAKLPAAGAAIGMSTLVEQNIRDAMKLAPSSGSPATGSIDKQVDEVQTQTDKLHFTGDDVKATLDAEEVTPTTASKTGYALTSAYDAAKTAAPAGAAMTLTSGERTTLSGVVKTTLEAAGGLLATIATKVAAIVFGPVSVSSPIDDDQDITITRCLDYLEANEQAIPWTNTSGTWCGGDLTGATLTFTAQNSEGTVVLSIAAATHVATGTQEIHLELTSAQTGLFQSVGRRYTYGLLIVKSGYRSHEITGNITVATTYNAPVEA